MIRTSVFCGILFSLMVTSHRQVGMAQEKPKALSVAPLASVSLPKIVPPQVADGRQEIKLPETVKAIDIGGGGRYLALHFASLRKIGVFDVNKLKIVGYVSATEADTKFAAGATKMVVVSGDSGVVARWDLATQKRELTQTIDLGGPAGHALMGAASAGPAIVSGSGRSYSGPGYLVDMNSLRVSPFKISNNRRGFGAGANVRISASGNVIGAWATGVSPSGLQSYVKSGTQWNGYYEHDSVGAIVPSPDGRLLYTGAGIFTSQLRRVGERGSRSRSNYSIPAVQGPYYLAVGIGERRGREKEQEKVSLKLEGDDRPLAEVPNLDPVFKPDDRYGRGSFTLDKRLFLIPDANVVIQLESSNQKLIVVEFDIDKALQSSKVDYLIVSSRPPLSVNAGQEFRYQIDVKSKKGKVKYSLDSGPNGMELSEDGLLSWATTSKSAAKSSVIVSVSDASEQQLFHTFELTVAGGDANSAGLTTTQTPNDKGDPLKPLETTPTQLTSDTVELKLPATASDVAVGAYGRLLFFHLSSLKRIAVLDVSKGKIVGYFPASDSSTKIVAGATRAFVFSLTQGVVTRYRLDTLKRELAVSIPFHDPIQYIGMGAGSDGPILLRTSKGTGALDSCSFHFVDTNTMKPMAVTWPNGRQFHSVYRDNNSIKVSTNGEVFVVAGVGALRLNGKSVARVGGRSDYPGLPSADGRYFLANGRLFNASLNVTGDRQTSYGVAVPSIRGNYFLSLTNRASIPSRTSAGNRQAKLYMYGDTRPLVTIQDIKVQAVGYSRYGNQLTTDKRLFFVPDAHVIATLLPSNDRVELRRFNVDDALEKSGVDYLIVTSHAPRTAELGKPYNYVMKVKSKRGGTKFSLDAAPKGMKLSAKGEITWTPPSSINQVDHKVIVTVSDRSGQSTFHTFTIGIPEIKAKVAAAEAERESQARIAQMNAERRARDQRLKAQQERMIAEATARRRADQLRAKSIADAAKFRSQMRTWTDISGDFQVVGRFVEILDKNTLVLQLQNGQRRRIKLNDLSATDIYEAVRADLLRQGIKPPTLKKESPFKLEK